MIDIKATREAQNEAIVNDVIWIRREYNLADAITNHNTPPELLQFQQIG